MNLDEGPGEGVAGAAAVFDLNNTPPPVATDAAAEALDDASFQLISCPTCGQNMQQLPGKKQIEHYRRCVVTAFNKTSQDFAPFLGSETITSDAAPPSFSSVGEWLEHLDLQQYQRLFLSAGHTMRSVSALTEAQLVAMGVPTVGARRRMLNAIDVLKSSLPQTAEHPQLPAKKRIKTCVVKAAPIAPDATAAAAFCGAPAHHADSLLQQRSITRVTEKAAEQAAAAILAATPAVAPAPSVPYLANSNMAASVPLFPGSSMRRVRSSALTPTPPLVCCNRAKTCHTSLGARAYTRAVLLHLIAMSVCLVMSSAGRVACALELCRRSCRR
jgi:hypothetical protein